MGVGTHKSFYEGGHCFPFLSAGIFEGASHGSTIANNTNFKVNSWLPQVPVLRQEMAFRPTLEPVLGTTMHLQFGNELNLPSSVFVRAAAATTVGTMMRFFSFICWEREFSFFGKRGN